MAKHVIAGAGQVGSQLALALAERGHEVVLISRSGRGPEGVTTVAADAADPARLTELAAGAAALYNCVNPAYHRWLTDWPPIAASFLKAAEASGAVYVMLGNLYVYAEPTAPMRETDPLTPSSAKAEVRAQMWRDALAAHEAGRIRAVEVRASDYFGPSCADQSHLGDRFMPRLLAGKPVQFAGDPTQPHSWTYVPDVVEALIVAAVNEKAWGRAWHVPTAAPRTARQIAADVCRLEGIPDPGVKAIPGAFMTLGGLFSPMIRELRHVRYQFVKPFVVDSSDFETAFGVKPTDMDSALSATVAVWRNP